jgi:hypothetical protein
MVRKLKTTRLVRECVCQGTHGNTKQPGRLTKEISYKERKVTGKETSSFFLFLYTAAKAFRGGKREEVLKTHTETERGVTQSRRSQYFRGANKPETRPGVARTAALFLLGRDTSRATGSPLACPNLAT